MQKSQRQDAHRGEEQRQRERRERNTGVHAIVPSAGQEHRGQRHRREQQLDQHVRRQDRVGPQAAWLAAA